MTKQPIRDASGRPPPSGRTTIRDVAERANVSIATVSNALNGTGRMMDETRERIRLLAEELAFRPNALANRLQLKNERTLRVSTSLSASAG